jgi:hypothetical protein
MHARLISITGADVTAAAKFLEDRASVIAGQKGFRQLAASGDRSKGNDGTFASITRHEQPLP